MSDTAAVRRRDYIETVLGRIARRGRLLATGAGLFFGLAFAIAAVLVAALADRWLILDSALRLWVLRGLLVLLAAGVAATIALALRHTASVRVARRVEALYPEFKEALVTYVQMRRGHRLTASQRQVLKVVGKRAGILLGHVDPDEVVNARRFVASGLVLLAALSVFLGLCVGLWTPFVTSVRRILAPRAEIAPATATRIEKIVVRPKGGPSATVLPAGRDAKALRHSACHIEATLAGKLPARAVLFYRPAASSAPWLSKARGQSATDALWRWKLDTGRHDLVFYIAAGDLRSDKHTIHLVDPPVVTDFRVRYHHPAYTQLAPTVRRGGDISALVGTRVAITATTNKPVAPRTEAPCPEILADRALARPRHRPVLRHDAGLVPLAADGNTLTATLTVRHPLTYTLHFPGRDGFWNRRPPKHVITPLRDRAPTVAIIAPPPQPPVPVDAPLAVRVRATDDIAVRRLELLVRRGDGPTDRIALPVPEPRLELDHTHTLDLRRLGLKPGDTLELRARALDGKPPEPNHTTSAPLRLTIAAPTSPRPAARKTPAPPDPAHPSPNAARSHRPDPAQSLERLRRLGRRQHRLAERIARLADDPPEPERQQLAEEQRDLARQLERLSQTLQPPEGHQPEEWQEWGSGKSEKSVGVGRVWESDTGPSPKPRPSALPLARSSRSPHSPHSPDQATTPRPPQRTTDPHDTGRATPDQAAGQPSTGSAGTQATGQRSSGPTPARQSTGRPDAGEPGRQGAGGQTDGQDPQGQPGGQAPSTQGTPSAGSQQPSSQGRPRQGSGQDAGQSQGQSASAQGAGQGQGQSASAQGAGQGQGQSASAQGAGQGQGQSASAQGAGQGQGQGASAQGAGQGPGQGSSSPAAGGAGSEQTGAGQTGSGQAGSGRGAAQSAGGQRSGGQGTGAAGTPGSQASNGQGTGSGGTGGGGTPAGQLRRLVGRLETLSDQLRSGATTARTTEAARLAARELLALGRKLRPDELAHRRIHSEGPSDRPRGRGETVRVGAGAPTPRAVSRVLPTDAPMPKADDLRRLVEGGQLRLSPSYRRLVEKYLEAVSER